MESMHTFLTFVPPLDRAWTAQVFEREARVAGVSVGPGSLVAQIAKWAGRRTDDDRAYALLRLLAPCSRRYEAVRYARVVQRRVRKEREASREEDA